MLNLNNVSSEHLTTSDIYFLLPEATFLTVIFGGLLLITCINTESAIYLTFRLNRFAQIGLLLTIALYLVAIFQQTWTAPTYVFNMNCSVSLFTLVIKITISFLSIAPLELYSNLLVYNIRTHTSHYTLIIMLTTLFLLLLTTAANLTAFFISLIGLSLGTYILLFKDMESSPLSRESGIKYYYLSTFSSGLSLYGIRLIYYISNTLDLTTIREWIASMLDSSSNAVDTSIPILCLTPLITGLLSKASLFPCHLWAPEVYEGSPDLVVAISVLPLKLVTVTVLGQLLIYVFEQVTNIRQPIIIFSAIGPPIWGALAAVFEVRIKKFLAYTSINQLGFLFIGMACATETAYDSVYFHLHLYIIMNLVLIIILVVLKTINESSIVSMSDPTDYRVAFPRVDVPLITLLIPTISSMAGIPPLAGFFSKYLVLSEAIKVSLFGLVITALVTSLISRYYYINIIKINVFDYVNRNVIVVLPFGLLLVIVLINIYLISLPLAVR